MELSPDCIDRIVKSVALEVAASRKSLDAELLSLLIDQQKQIQTVLCVLAGNQTLKAGTPHISSFDGCQTAIQVANQSSKGACSKVETNDNEPMMVFSDIPPADEQESLAKIVSNQQQGDEASALSRDGSEPKHVMGVKSYTPKTSRCALIGDLDDPETSWFAFVYCLVIDPLILLSTLLLVLHKFDPPLSDFFDSPECAAWLHSFDVLFTVELVLRFVVYDNKKRYLLDSANIVDIISVIPSLVLDCIQKFDNNPGRFNVHQSEDGEMAMQIIRCIVPMFRLSKILRRFTGFHLLIEAAKVAVTALPLLIFVFIFNTLIFASLLYIAENPAGVPKYPSDESHVQNFQDALWLTVVSMTTVGYGDMTPKSDAGRILLMVVVFVQCLYMAIPLGILGYEITSFWVAREYIWARNKVQKQAARLGIHSNDVVALFNDLAGEHSKMKLEDFEIFWKIFNIHLKPGEIKALFDALDEQKSGSIRCEDLVSHLQLR